MDRRNPDDNRTGPESTSTQPAKRAWRTPEIVDVGDAMELTEGIIENVKDSPSAAMAPTYRP